MHPDTFSSVLDFNRNNEDCLALKIWNMIIIKFLLFLNQKNVHKGTVEDKISVTRQIHSIGSIKLIIFFGMYNSF